MHRPAFITFTGVDDATILEGMVELSGRYPVEWGVLIDRHKKGVPLFPDERQVDRLRRAGLRLSAHLCGEIAAEIARGDAPALNLGGFSRVQVNHGRAGADAAVTDAVRRFAARHGLRGVLQCSGPFPAEPNGVDWLFDVSFGEGVRPTSFPRLDRDHPFCGFSGGIDPGNVGGLLAGRLRIDGAPAFWIDMESGVRSGGRFDLARCEAVCRAVYDDPDSVDVDLNVSSQNR